MKTFRNKIVVVTGAGSGMGRAYALEFAAEGALLALNDFDENGLNETVNLVRKKVPGCRILAKAFDVGSNEAMLAFAEEVRTTLGAAHAIVNNAGVGGGGAPVWAMTDADYERTLRINFFGVLYGTRAFLPQLFANGEGAVVNVSSIFGFVGTPNTSDYCAAKFAVRGFTESLMVELEGTPIGVHLVHPGGIKTNIAKGVANGEEFTRRYLKTDANEMVRYVIRHVKANQPRIVHGHQSFRVWLASWAMPLKKRNRLLRGEMKDLMLQPNYDVLRTLKR